MNIVEIDGATRSAVDALIRDEWAGPMIVSRGHLIDTSLNPGFVYVEQDQIKGFVTYLIRSDVCEITVLSVFDENKGIGSALIERVIERVKEGGCVRVWLITTNDNIHAIRFYQRRGFALAAVHINALDGARQLKPSIPLIGMDDIPLAHEFEFEVML